MSITGTNFQNGSVVNLTRTGYQPIIASDVVIVNSTKINCVLPITGVSAGSWNISVTNPNGQIGTKTNGFTVTIPSTRPTVVSLAPSSGLNTRPLNITSLVGTNFQNGSVVNLTKTGYPPIIATDVVVINSTKITCILPVTGASIGSWNVSVTNPDGQIGIRTNGFTVSASSTKPTIVRLTPSSGLNTSLINITNLSGTNFQSGLVVNLSQTRYQNITATNVVVVNSTFATCVLPITGVLTGSWNVSVTNPDGQIGTRTNGFTVSAPSTKPTIVRLTPSSGLNTSQVNITNLSGTNFQSGLVVNLSQTRYQNITATNVVVVNSTFATCVLPITGVTPGAWNVSVTNPDGQIGTRTNGFTVSAPSTKPTIIRLTPSSGLNTSSINIPNLSGTNFQVGMVVNLTRSGYTPIDATDVVVFNSTFATCIIPITRVTPGAWNVSVINPDGQIGTRISGFTVTSLPSVLNSRLVSSSIPASTNEAQSYPVSVVMTNTGTANWIESSQIRLGAVGDDIGDAARFGIDRILLPTGTTVRPGQQYTFTFTMTAPSEGNYTPVLQMIQENGQWFGDRVSTPIIVNDTGTYPVKANFTANSTSGLAPLTVKFTDCSTGSPTARTWSFGDGKYSSLRSPVHTYLAPGSFSISLTVSGSEGNDTLTRSGYANVTSQVNPFVIQSPRVDEYTNESVNFSGSLIGVNTTALELTFNGVSSTLPINATNFSTILNFTALNTVNLKATDYNGTVWTDTLYYDGDHLSGSDEIRYGFDPLNPDSDCTYTPANEAGNGISDGYEQLGGDQLPIGIKVRLNANPYVADTDGDGLTDYFELVKMGLFTDVNKVDTDGNGVSDAQEDFDSDNLTNLQEQTYGTNPILDDTDGDGLKDGDEIAAGSDPLRKDTDLDGLDDDSEIRLGTNVTNPDSNGNGILDGNETYTSSTGNTSLGVQVWVDGAGDIGKKIQVSNFTSPVYLNNPALVSNIIDISLNGSFSNATLTIPYDPAKVNNTANLTLASFNRETGTYDIIPSTVDPVAHTVTGSVSQLSQVGIFDQYSWKALFDPYRDLFPFDSNASWTVKLENGQLQSTQPQYFNNSALFPEGKYAIQACGLYNNAGLIPGLWYLGAKQAEMDYDDGTGMTVLHYTNETRNDSPVCNITSSGNILQIEHSGGQIGIWNNDTGSLTDNYGEVTYTLKYLGPLDDIDTDGDGLSDRVEKHGFIDGFGNVYHTDYLNPDSDYDGLLDGEETGDFSIDSHPGYYDIKSSPLDPDTDHDGVRDFDEQELSNTDTGITCSPLIPDSDSDGLSDGEELYKYGTDPADPDTDGDGWNDGKEVSNCYDPLTYDEYHFTYPQRIAEGLVGFIAGEFLVDGHPTSEYFIGWMISGYFEVGDARDVFGSLFHQDPVGAVINAAGLIPLAGDAGKTIDKGILFLKSAPLMKPFVSVFCHSLLSDLKITRLIHGDKVVDSLLEKGFTPDAILYYEKMFGKLDRLDNALESSKLYERYPNIKEFIIKAYKDDPTFMSGRFKWNIKLMVTRYEEGRDIYGFIGNVQGAYTERLMASFQDAIKNSNGILSFRVIKDLTHINHPGVDRVIYYERKMENNPLEKVLLIGESKAPKQLSISDLKNYIRKAKTDNVVSFQPTYLGKEICEEFFTDPSVEKRFLVYINSPESANLLTTIENKYPYKYWSEKKKQYFMGEVIIEKVAVNT